MYEIRLWNTDEMMLMGGKPKYSEKNLSQYHFIHHISYMCWPGIKPWCLWWVAGENTVTVFDTEGLVRWCTYKKATESPFDGNI